MIDVKIEDKIYNLPENWSEVTWNKYQQTQMVEFESDDHDEEYLISIFSILMDCEKETIEKLDIPSFYLLRSKIAFMQHMPEVSEDNIKYRFDIDGKIYLFNRNIPVYSIGQRFFTEKRLFQHFIAESHILLTGLLSEMDENGNAIVLKKEKEIEAFALQNYEKVINLSVEQLYPILFFFCNSETTL